MPPLTRFHRSVCRRAVSRRTLVSLERWLWWDFPWTSSGWPWRVPSSRCPRSEVALYGWCCSSPSHHTRPLCLPCVCSGWSLRRGRPPGLDTEALPHARLVSVDVYRNKWTSFNGHYVFTLHWRQRISSSSQSNPLLPQPTKTIKLLWFLYFRLFRKVFRDW